MDKELSNEALAVIAKAEKLFALAKGNANENEAAAAMEKGMALLEAYNLDMAVLGKTPKDNARDDKRLKGGLYQWQRDLWEAAASMNFCMYQYFKGLRAGQKYEHRVIGRGENVIATRLMSEYLQDTIERLAVQYGKENYPEKSRFIRPLIAYREGIAERLVYRMWTIRRERAAEDARKAKEQQAASKHPGAAPGTGLVLASVIQTEDDLNNDYLYGYEPGTTAKRRAEWAAKQAAAEAAANEELARKKAEWEELVRTNPEEAARIMEAEAAALRKEERKRSRRKDPVYRERKATAREQRRMTGDFNDGYAKGDEVGLDRQVSGTKTARLR